MAVIDVTILLLQYIVVVYKCSPKFNVVKSKLVTLQ